MKTRTTVIAIRLRQLGDVLATLGTLRAIKESDPNRRVVYVVDSLFHELLSEVEFIDLLLPEPPDTHGLQGSVEYERYIQKIRELRADSVIDFHGSLRTAILSALTGASIRIGFNVRLRSAFYTHVEPRAEFENGRRLPRTSHESAMSLARRGGLVSAAGCTRETITVPAVRIESASEIFGEMGLPAGVVSAHKLIGLNPGKAYASKEWGEDRFVEVCERLTYGGNSVLVMWGPGERPRAVRIASRVQKGVFLPPPLTLPELPGVLASLSLLVTIDSGLKHLAVAVGTPTVTLFGPTSPAEWHMGGANDRVLWAGLSCSPCRLLECPFGRPPCMQRLTPDAVINEVASVTESLISV